VTDHDVVDIHVRREVDDLLADGRPGAESVPVEVFEADLDRNVRLREGLAAVDCLERSFGRPTVHWRRRTRPDCPNPAPVDRRYATARHRQA
jgi:hypothetical protein